MALRTFGTKKKAYEKVFNSIPKEHFPLFLKGRFDYGIPEQLLRTLRNWMILRNQS